MSQFVIQLFAVTLCLSSTIQLQDRDLEEITMSSGKVLGYKSETGNGTKFWTFQGIPYAEPPIGELRYASPVPKKSWGGTLNATYQKSVCSTTDFNGTKVIGSEDCLFINVYTTHLPNNDKDHPKLTCLVWIHGGAFYMGSGNLDEHQADWFLDHQVLVVSFNYRLGVFGFISTEDKVMPGNYGLKDQILALEWVQKNIGYFGGDPKNVTIFGQSAGAVSCSYLLNSCRAKGLFHKVIMDSGTVLTPWSKARNARQLAFNIGAFNGIVFQNSSELLLALRRVPCKNLVTSSNYAAIRDLLDPLNGLPYAPVTEVPSKDAVVVGDNYENLLAGRYSHVPILLGYNSLEGRDVTQVPWYGTLVLIDKYNLFPQSLVPLDMNANSTGKQLASNQIQTYYFQNRFITSDADTAYYVTDNEFIRGIQKAATMYQGNVYLYKFSFIHGVTHKYFKPEGVAHSEELQFIWNQVEQNTSAAKLTTCRTVKMWSNFAKYGNPTPPTHLDKLINVTWPIVNATNSSDIHYLNIDTNLAADINPDKISMNFWEMLYYLYGNRPYDTY